MTGKCPRCSTEISVEMTEPDANDHQYSFIIRCRNCNYTHSEKGMLSQSEKIKHKLFNIMVPQIEKPVVDVWKTEDQKCLHQRCPECKGTGVKKDHTPCVHMISCPCSRCSPRMF